MKRLSLVLLGALLLFGASSAQASTIFLLTSDHCTGGCGTAPYGTITLTQTGTTVDVSVVLTAGYSFAKTGAADNQAFKFNGTGVAVGDITVDAHVPGLVAATGAFNGDGTGNFIFGINCPTCGGGGSDAFSTDILFHVANATIADLTVPNNLGNTFVADVLAPNGNTGPVDATVPVPEPGATLLFGVGSLIAGTAIRRRR